MRRPVMYVAGLLLAAGGTLAFAGPASAAVSHNGSAAAVANNPWGDGTDIDYDFDYRSSNYDLDYRLNREDNDNNSQFALLNVLSPNGEGNQGLGLGILGTGGILGG
ncbi:hypothetical protein AB0J83_14455 [Actinoplanes sp. NPDC049596]|uniref:hypothetical protein n=1 Tax=unclassified Actinoplanes TaxID=2626549 RepID=UPI00341DB9D5